LCTGTVNALSHKSAVLRFSRAHGILGGIGGTSRGLRLIEAVTPVYVGES